MPQALGAFTAEHIASTIQTIIRILSIIHKDIYIYIYPLPSGEDVRIIHTKKNIAMSTGYLYIHQKNIYAFTCTFRITKEVGWDLTPRINPVYRIREHYRDWVFFKKDRIAEEHC